MASERREERISFTLPQFIGISLSAMERGRFGDVWKPGAKGGLFPYFFRCAMGILPPFSPAPLALLPFTKSSSSPSLPSFPLFPSHFLFSFSFSSPVGSTVETPPSSSLLLPQLGSGTQFSSKPIESPEREERHRGE